MKDLVVNYLIGGALAIPVAALLHFATAYISARMTEKLARAAISAGRIDVAHDLLSHEKKGFWRWSVRLFISDDLKKLSDLA